MTWGRLWAVGRTVLAALGRRRRSVRRLVAWSLLEALPVLLAGQVTARATDQGFLAGRPAVGLAWLGLLATAVLVGAYGTYRVHRCLAEVVEPFRDDLLRHTAAGALRHATRTPGPADTAAVARLTHQVEIVRDTFAGLVMVVRGFLFTAGAAMLGLFSLAPVVVLLVAPPLLAGLVLFAITLPRMVSWQRRYLLADEGLADAAGAVIQGRRDVIASGAEASVGASVGGYIDTQARAERALARMAALRGVCLGIGGWLPLVVLLVAAPWLAERPMSTGAILGALVYVLHGLQPALYTLVRGLGGGGLRLVVTLDRLLSTAPGAGPAPGPAPLPTPRVAAAGATPARPEAPRQPVAVADRRPVALLRQVTFRYGPHSEPVVQHLDLAVAPDEQLAIVGPSGIGKSTLTGLLAGTLRPQEGQVRLAGDPAGPATELDPADLADLAAGGVNLGGADRPVNPADLARLRVLIPQEAYVFTGSLWENLTYLAPDVDRATVDGAVGELGMAPVAGRLGGYHAEVRPAALSAGEKQLVALVRAYLAGSRLVLLDEATCHLDPVAEARVERAFAAAPGALVVVAHRISSALRARRVMMMDGHEVVIGDHQELVARSAGYRELVGHWQRVGAPR